MFTRMLIANRGEIAIRVMRTARELGISPIAIYSQADAHALHVRMADQAVCVGPEASTESYLKIDAVLDAARQSGAEAIHPGYGFLSENAEFARRVAEAGLIWVGPPPSAIAQMGDKLTARATVAAAGVPLVPGATPTDVAEARAAAISIGFPVMVKASSGGGGKGMRKVGSAEAFNDAFNAAKREAAAAFGDDRVYVEKFVTRPHHVEIQVLCDSQGTALYVGDRECSVQRRHQKVIEECPSPFIDEATRQAMGAVAVAAAKACDYVGAGTVEFLVSGAGEFYFLEMNTRLQVEHPVTELVYGIDLVEWQIRIAAGEALPFTQADLQPRGHALQCRLYAEDPETFLPSPGTLHHVRWPTGPGVRVDAGVDSASVVPMAYDPMIAKLCTYGADRGRAIARMRRALDETVILGVTTNTALHHRVLVHPEFVAGDYDTSLLERPLPDSASTTESVADAITAAAIQALLSPSNAPAAQASATETLSPWWQDRRR